MSDAPQFLDPFSRIHQTFNRLPHWQQAGALYFLTFRLNDSIPKAIVSQINLKRTDWLKTHPQPWSPQDQRTYGQHFARLEENTADEGHGSCILRMPYCRKILEDSLQHGDPVDYQHVCWVIMPNHVHALTQISGDQRLETVVQAWKSASSHKLNQHLERSGILWQKSYRDRLIRNEQHLVNVVRYIRSNPVKARLRDGEFTLYESALAKEIA